VLALNNWAESQLYKMFLLACATLLVTSKIYSLRNQWTLLGYVHVLIRSLCTVHVVIGWLARVSTGLLSTGSTRPSNTILRTLTGIRILVLGVGGSCIALSTCSQAEGISLSACSQAEVVYPEPGWIWPLVTRGLVIGLSHVCTLLE
jgi:hypothetical protein